MAAHATGLPDAPRLGPAPPPVLRSTEPPRRKRLRGLGVRERPHRTLRKSLGADVRQPGMDARQAGEVVGLYVHTPFCASKCAYCDFVSYAGLEHLHDAYVDAVCKEISAAQRARARTVYFGGGTPPILPAPQLARLLDALRERFEIASDAETTIEANPNSIKRAKVTALRKAGFNRISIGVQSFDEDVLAVLGRTHDPAAARHSVRLARDAGFENVSIDLIFGVPGESLDSWRRTLQQAVALDPDHISAYCLSVEDQTPLQRRIARGELARPDDDLAAEMMALTSDTLTRAGYEHYEISNFAKPGRRCDHNVDCWRYADYLGFGVAAHSKIGSVRFANTADVSGYVRGVGGGTATLSQQDAACEATILGLRLMEGIPADRLRAIWGAAGTDVTERLEYLGREGLIETEGAVRLTESGLPLANEVFRRFV